MLKNRPLPPHTFYYVWMKEAELAYEWQMCFIWQIVVTQLCSHPTASKAWGHWAASSWNVSSDALVKQDGKSAWISIPLSRWHHPTLARSSCQEVTVLQKGSLASCPASSLELWPRSWSPLGCQVCSALRQRCVNLAGEGRQWTAEVFSKVQQEAGLVLCLKPFLENWPVFWLLLIGPRRWMVFLELLCIRVQSGCPLVMLLWLMKLQGD